MDHRKNCLHFRVRFQSSIKVSQECMSQGFLFNKFYIIIADNTYHIPVCLWLMDTHPQNAPICYVKPTPDMQIRVSMYIDHNGKIYLPYLHDWQPVISKLLFLNLYNFWCIF